jgi:hypothetical protein
MHAPVEAVSGWEPMKDEADCVSFRGALSQYRPDQRKTNNRVLDFVIDKTKKQFERVYQKIERGSLLFLGFDYTFPQGDPDPEQGPCLIPISVWFLLLNKWFVGFGTVFQHSFNDTARESKTPQKLKSTPPRPRRFKDHPQMEARTPPNSTKRADSSAHLAEHAAAATDADSDIDMSEGDLNDTFPKSPRHHFHQHSHSSKGAAAFRGESIEAMDLTSDNTSHRGDQNPRMPAARKIVAQRARVSKAKPLRHPCPTSELSTEKTVATTKRTRSVSMLIREAEAEAEADKMILQANKKSRRY